MDPDEPLLLAAYEKARAALPRLRSAFGECPDTAFVRFPFRTSQDEVEHLWGRMHRLSSSHTDVEVVTQPFTHEKELVELTVPIDALEDWEVEFPDGQIEGGYTTRAMCAYAERESLDVPREIVKRLRRYRTEG